MAAEYSPRSFYDRDGGTPRYRSRGHYSGGTPTYGPGDVITPHRGSRHSSLGTSPPCGIPPNESVMYPAPVDISPGPGQIMRHHDLHRARLNRINEIDTSPQTHHHHQTVTDDMPSTQLHYLEKKMDEMFQSMKQIMEQQDMMRHELEMLKHSQSTEGNTTPKRPRKKMVKRALSERISKLHEALPNKINPDECQSSSHNKRVIETLIEEAMKPDDYDKEIVTLAVRRKYESLRRQTKNDDEEGCRKKAKYRQRKQRAFDRRKSVLTKNEQQYFELLTVDYMTEESDDEETGKNIILHKLTWRSERNKLQLRRVSSLFGNIYYLYFRTEFMDERIGQKVRKKMEGKESVTPHKQRNIGTASASKPPPNAPKWAVDPFVWSESETQRTDDQDQCANEQADQARENGEIVLNEFTLAN